MALLLALPARAQPAGRDAGRRGARPARPAEAARPGVLRRAEPAVRPGARLGAARRGVRLPHRLVSAGPPPSAPRHPGAGGRGPARAVHAVDAAAAPAGGPAPHRDHPRSWPRWSVVWVACAVFSAQLVEGVPVADTVRDHPGQRARLPGARAASTTASVRRPMRGRRVPRHPRRPAADRAARQGRGRRLRGELRPGRASRTRSSRRRSVRSSTRGTSELSAAGFRRAERLPHLADRRRRQLAGARHAAVRPVDRQPAALHRNLLASDRLTLNGAFRRAGWQTVGRHAGRHQGLAGGRLLRLRPVLRRRDARLPRPEVQLRRPCPTSTPWPPSQRLEHGKPRRHR